MYRPLQRSQVISVIQKPIKQLRLPQQGFTLLEVIIALVISAIIALMAYESLDGASRGAVRTNEVIAEINQLDRAWQLIASDLRHVLQPDGRNIRFEAQSLQSRAEDAEQLLMVFKRRGWVNFSNLPRSDLQLVAYRISEGVLWRDFLPEYNRELGQIDIEREGLHQKILEGIEDVQLRFLHQGLISLNGKSELEGSEYSDNWVPQWPDTSQAGATGLPLAIEIRLTLKDSGESVRLFAFPQQE